MRGMVLFDVAPDPVTTGIGVGVAIVVILVVSAVILIAGGLTLFLWYRKRRARAVEVVRRN